MEKSVVVQGTLDPIQIIFLDRIVSNKKRLLLDIEIENPFFNIYFLFIF